MVQKDDIHLVDAAGRNTKVQYNRALLTVVDLTTDWSSLYLILALAIIRFPQRKGLQYRKDGRLRGFCREKGLSFDDYSCY